MWVWPENRAHFSVIKLLESVAHTVRLHQTAQRPERHLFVIMLIHSAESVRLEVSSMAEATGDLRSEGLDREIVTPNLAVVRIGEQLSFE